MFVSFNKKQEIDIFQITKIEFETIRTDVRIDINMKY